MLFSLLVVGVRVPVTPHSQEERQHGIIMFLLNQRKVDIRPQWVSTLVVRLQPGHQFRKDHIEGRANVP